MSIIKFKLVHEDAKIPAYQTKGSAGADLKSVEEVFIDPGHLKVVSVGFSVEIEQGFEMQIRPRSGMAANNWVTVLNAPGTIDSDYRGVVKVILFNHGENAYHVMPGMRIAQMVIARVEQPDLIAVESLTDTARGEGGFGSTGVSDTEHVSECHSFELEIENPIEDFNDRDMFLTEVSLFLAENGRKMSGDTLVDYLNQNGITKLNGQPHKRGRGIYKILKDLYDKSARCGYQWIADKIAVSFTTKNGGMPWE